MIWFYIFLSIFLVSLLSLIGLLTLVLRLKVLEKILIYLVSFSAGALLGDVFLHLFPEMIPSFNLNTSFYLLLGLLFSFLAEKVIHWRHCHHLTNKKHPHPFALMNLIGDIVHNFLDGLIIAASYLTSFQIGIATTLAVLFHEIPQEIGDFGILLHGGFSKGKALFLNFLTALTAFLGAFLIFFLSSFQNPASFLIPFAAGNFLYIAGSDLIPELHKCEFTFKNSFYQFLAIVLGISIMYALTLLEF